MMPMISMITPSTRPVVAAPPFVACSDLTRPRPTEPRMTARSARMIVTMPRNGTQTMTIDSSARMPNTSAAVPMPLRGLGGVAGWPQPGGLPPWSP